MALKRLLKIVFGMGRSGMGIVESMLFQLHAELGFPASSRVNQNNFTRWIGVLLNKVRYQVDVLVFVEEVTANNDIEQAKITGFISPVNLLIVDCLPVVKLCISLQKKARLGVVVGCCDIVVSFVKQQAG